MEGGGGETWGARWASPGGVTAFWSSAPAATAAITVKLVVDGGVGEEDAADPPESELLLMRPPQVSYSIRSPRAVHFLPTATESKASTASSTRRCPSPSLPPLHSRLDGQDTGDLYIIDSVLHPNKAEVRPQFEALLWRGITTSIASHSHRFWHCDVLPLPPWITHHRNAFVHGHALVGDTSICFSISGYGSEGSEGTYCFHTATREWSKAGDDWVMPFIGKADYVPELDSGLASPGKTTSHAPPTSPASSEGGAPPDKIRIWIHDDDMPAEWRLPIVQARVISLGSGRLMVVDFLDSMVFDKDCNEMCVDKQFALFTGMELAYSNGKVKNNSRNGAIKDNGNESGSDKVKNSRNGAIKDNDHTSAGNENGGGKRKGMVRGLRMMKHKSGRYMFNNQQSLQEQPF
ncbi:hypothetical protein ZWY2020_026088 [Hordeum vulgare]|nr:hypothetical protein ZWY2020_026088 [Hordeum vulgare]